MPPITPFLTYNGDVILETGNCSGFWTRFKPTYGRSASVTRLAYRYGRPELTSDLGSVELQSLDTLVSRLFQQ